MKLVLLTLAVLGLQATAAEIKVLKDYDKVTKRYSGVVTSTTDKPVALTAMLSETDGLCYKGTLAEVQQLVESMAVLANANGDAVVYGKPVVVAAHGGLALTVPYKTDAEVGEWTWAQIPVCVR